MNSFLFLGFGEKYEPLSWAPNKREQPTLILHPLGSLQAAEAYGLLQYEWFHMVEIDFRWIELRTMILLVDHSFTRLSDLI